MEQAAAHVYAEVYKAVYEAHSGKLDAERRREAERCAKEAVWQFKKTHPKTHYKPGEVIKY